MMKKYELMNETIIIKDGTVLHRIKALTSFGNVVKGDLGGWIEKENNLSHNDTAWVYDDACVYNNARVYDNAKVYDNACVYNKARLCDDTKVYDDACVGGMACVGSKAKVYGNAKVYANACILDGHIIGKVFLSSEDIFQH